ncbi:MAG: HEAT repeat domain-containing protein [Persicimonas sp.]
MKRISKMQSVPKMLALALTCVLACAALASTASAQQSPASGDTTDQTTDPDSDSPVPFPFDGNEAEYERATTLLSGFHGIPAKEVFEQKLDNPEQILLGIALNEDTSAVYRKQALAALAYWPGDTVFSLYGRLLKDTQTEDTLRHRVMLLMAEHFEDRALEKLRPFLSDDDLQLRLSAIEAIRRLPSDDAVEALREALKTETNTVAQKRLEQYTQTLR